MMNRKVRFLAHRGGRLAMPGTVNNRYEQEQWM